MDPDPAFEYDAPTYMDFNLLQQGKIQDDDADEWFDYHIDDESHMPDDTFDDCFVLAQTPEIKIEQIEVEIKQEGCGTDTGPGETDEDVKHHDAIQGLQGQSSGDSNGVMQQDSHETAPTQQSDKWRIAMAREAARKATASIRSIFSNTRTPKAPKPSNSLTFPDTPDVLRRCESKKQLPKSTEEIRLEEIERLRKEAKKKLRKSRKSFKRLAKTSAPAPVKYSKPPTEAMEFKFKTKERDRGKVSAKPVSGLNPKEFPMTLRSSKREEDFHPMIPTNKPPTPDGVTKVKPFKFQLDSRLNSKFTKDAKKGKFVSMAEAVQQFQKATPPRFRSSAKRAAGEVGKNSSNLEMTIPKTPKLATKGRSRPTVAKSTIEEEDEEVAKIKEYQFKAKPINPGVFNSHGLYGVPKRKAEATMTVAVSPHLKTEERIQLRKAQDQPPEDRPKFHARPMPKDIIESIQGVPEKRLRPLTFPESPALALKRRRLDAPKEENEKQDDTDHVIKANPVPDFSRVFKPQLEHKTTNIQPFLLEERYIDKPTRETLVQQILRKEKKSEFKAQPLPQFGTPLLPNKPPLLPTQPAPFTLHTEVRGQQHTSKWIDKITEEAKKARTEAEFKAKEVKSLYMEPFVPQKSSKPLTSVGNIMLNTQVRHEQRAKYDAEQREKERAREQETLQRRALRETEEASALIDYRRSLVHKAQPVHHYTPIYIKPSDKPLTNPETPMFYSDHRLRGLATDV